MIFNKKASSLVEILMYFALLAVFMGVAISFGLQIAESSQRSAEQSEVQSQVNRVLNELQRLAREAEGVNIESSVFDSDSGRLSFVMSDAAVNPSVLYVDSGQIFVQEATNPAEALSLSELNVSQLRFTRLTGTKTPEFFRVEGVLEDQSFKTSISLRP